LFTYSEQPNNADWSGGGNGKPTMTDNFAEAPNGTMTASKMEVAGTGYQIRQNNAQENTQMNVSVWLRTNTGTKTIQLFLNNANTASQNITVTTTWTRYEISGLVTTLSGSGRNGLQTLEALTSGAYILVWGLQLSVGLTAKPYFPTTDRLNVPRLTYQNGGGGCPSLLLEKQSTNYMPYSENISLWYAPADGVTLTSNTTDTVSPDGTNNASKIAIVSGSKRSYEITNSVAGVGTFSAYVKAGTSTSITLFTSSGSINIGYNLSTLAITTGSGTGTITSVGNGWYRITATNTLGASEVLQVLYTGTAGQTIYIWGFQVEASSYVTSYIFTNGASATRVADACSKTGISSLIGQTQGVVFCDFNYIATTNTSDTTPIRLLGSGSAGMYLEINSNNTFEVVVVNSVGTLVFNSTSSAQIAGRYKFAIAYNANDYAFYLNGTQIAVDTSGAFASASLDSLNLGMYQSGSQHLDGSINEAILFSTRLSNSELASLTSL
jgi:hypothetical protein